MTSPIGTIFFEGKCLKSISFLKAVSFTGNHKMISQLSPEILFYPEGNHQREQISCYLSCENFFGEKQNRKKILSIKFNIEILSPDDEVIYGHETSGGYILSERFSDIAPDWGLRHTCDIAFFKNKCRNLARVRIGIHGFKEDDNGFPDVNPKITRSTTEVPYLNVMAIEDDIDFAQNLASLSEGGLFSFVLKKVVVSSFRLAIDKIKLPPTIKTEVSGR